MPFDFGSMELMIDGKVIGSVGSFTAPSLTVTATDPTVYVPGRTGPLEVSITKVILSEPKTRFDVIEESFDP